MFIRRQGYGVHDAQDLTQEFLARLLKRNAFANLDPHKGRFRSFLLAALEHFKAQALPIPAFDVPTDQLRHVLVNARALAQSQRCDGLLNILCRAPGFVHLTIHNKIGTYSSPQCAEQKHLRSIGKAFDTESNAPIFRQACELSRRIPEAKQTC